MVTISSKMTGNVGIINISGAINVDSIDKIEKAYIDLADQKSDIICLNFKHVLMIDSAGLGMLIKLLRVSEKNNIQFVITEIKGNVSSLFDFSKLENIFLLMSDDEFRNTYLV